MKINNETPTGFTPFTITVENEDEAQACRTLFGAMSQHNMKKYFGPGAEHMAGDIFFHVDPMMAATGRETMLLNITPVTTP